MSAGSGVTALRAEFNGLLGSGGGVQRIGVSFREHLCRIRVEASKQLLLNKQYSLADIAVSMGFPDQSYYCKVFKRIVGITPGKHRA